VVIDVPVVNKTSLETSGISRSRALNPLEMLIGRVKKQKRVSYRGNGADVASKIRGLPSRTDPSKPPLSAYRVVRAVYRASFFLSRETAR
jgi:hypothetical protein